MSEQQEGEVQQRPDWLPEKFASVEQMATAYKELEKKMSSGGRAPEPAPEEASDSELPPEASAEGSDDPSELKISDTPIEASDEWLQEFNKEFRENGSLSEDSYKKLQAKGLPKQFVDSYIEGQRALVQRHTSEVFGAVGGRDEYAKLMQWAQQNLSESEVKTFNQMIVTPSIEQAKLAVMGLKARRDSAHGSRPKMQQGSGAPQSSARVEPFENLRDLVAAQNDARYTTSQKYRDEVARRLEASNL